MRKEFIIAKFGSAKIQISLSEAYIKEYKNRRSDKTPSSSPETTLHLEGQPRRVGRAKEGELMELEIEKIDSNPRQPRSNYPECKFILPIAVGWKS